MPDRMLAARFHGPHDLRLEEVDRPKPVPGWVVIEPAAVGICGTDAHIYAGDFPVNAPVTLGHRSPVISVHWRWHRRSLGGRPGLCGTACVLYDLHLLPWWARAPFLDKLAFGVHPDGGMAEAVAVPRRTVYRVPDHMDPSIAALAEPVACSVHGFDRLSPRQGESLAIVGAGPAGLIDTHFAPGPTKGASPIVVVEPDSTRRQIALAFGADVVVDPTADGWEEPAMGATGGLGFDNVVEAVGGGQTLETAIGLAARGAKVLVFGVAAESDFARIRPYEVFAKELTLLGTVINPYTQSRAVQLLKPSFPAETTYRDRAPYQCWRCLRRLDERTNLRSKVDLIQAGRQVKNIWKLLKEIEMMEKIFVVVAGFAADADRLWQ